MEQTITGTSSAPSAPESSSRSRAESVATGNDNGARRLGNALGWFSIGLGLAQIIVPRNVARLAGAEPTTDTLRLMRALGLRELSSGVGILSGRRTDDWMRARVAGDLMDLALLGRVMLENSSGRGRTATATLAVLGVTALDMLAAKKVGQENASSRNQGNEDNAMQDEPQDDARRIRRAITIKRPPNEVAAFWRQHASDDKALSEAVRFIPAPGDRGTEVHLERAYEKPGPIAGIIAKFRHDDPAQHMFDELFALKQLLETGDIVVSDAWVNGPHTPHPAQPE